MPAGIGACRRGGVDYCPRLKMSPLICQEIAHNAPPQVVFFTKNETISFYHKFLCFFKIHLPS